MNHLHITSLWINSLMQAFALQGLDTDALVEGLEGFEGHQLQQSPPLNLTSARTLWHRAEIQAKDPLLGITIGSMQNFRSSGVLMPICWHSPNSRTALEHISSFQSLISENGQFRISTSNGSHLIECEYVPRASAAPVNHQQVLSVVTGTLLLLREISGGSVLSERLYAPHGINAEAVTAALDCPTENREGNFTLCFIADSLNKTISGRDEHLYHINLAYAEGMIRAKREGQSLIHSIKRIIDTSRPATVSIIQVAEVLGIHQRVLQRNLAEQGISFREIKEALLKELALDLLIGQSLEVDTIAEQLGYSEASAFQRAFKNWFGVTPRKFCEENSQ
jgi:AraC-like DNA-binding protein